MQNAKISTAGEVDFPLWVKVIGWIIGLSFPVALMAGVWVATQIVDMKLTLADMKPRIEQMESLYTETAARAAHENLGADISRNRDDIDELQRLHGRN